MDKTPGMSRDERRLKLREAGLVADKKGMEIRLGKVLREQRKGGYYEDDRCPDYM